MVGSPADGGKMKFNPLGSLTRAEAAQLLYNVVGPSDEKITFDDDEEKVTFDEETQVDTSLDYTTLEYTKPNVSITTVNGKLKLLWDEINDTRLKGFKIVISKTNPNPVYSADGYMAYLDDGETEYTIDISKKYNNGDFGNYLEAGESYYFSVTAVYDDKKVAGNAIYKKVPEGSGTTNESTYPTPQVFVELSESSILVEWQKIDDPKFQGYKVVASKSNPEPMYSADGYYKWIQDKNILNTEIHPGSPYNGGDVGTFQSGVSYYISVTAVYTDKKVRGNAVYVEMP
jgi:hypothetical protein